jgi:NAD+ kinase
MELKTFFVYAKNRDKCDSVKAVVEKQGFEYSCENPDFAITVGGDGTYLEAERQLPGIPKLLVRDSLICYKCHNEPLDEMLEMLKSGRGRIKELIKLEAIYSGGSFLAVNDIVLRNENPTRAIRFKTMVDGKEVESAIGDGVVVATPFGSTGYYRAVTRSCFSAGIGVAFNNSMEEKDPLILKENSELGIEITRGKGQLAADNYPSVVAIAPGNCIIIKKASQVARLVSHNHET